MKKIELDYSRESRSKENVLKEAQWVDKIISFLSVYILVHIIYISAGNKDLGSAGHKKPGMESKGAVKPQKILMI